MLISHTRFVLFALLLWSIALTAVAQQRGYDSLKRGEDFVVLDRYAYFAGAEPEGRANLWRTDGTAEGTTRLTEVEAGTRVRHPFVARGTLYFFIDRDRQLSLWRLDSASLQTQPVVDLGTLNVQTFVRGENVTWLIARQPTSANWFTPWSLWRSDGTAAGTTFVAPLRGMPEHALAAGSLLYFKLNTLWRSDGTLVGTFELPVAALIIGDGLGHESLAAWPANGQLYLSGYRDGARGTWRTDGTVDGTRRIYDEPLASAAELHGQAYLLTDRGTLLRDDGTPTVIRRIGDDPWYVDSASDLTRVGDRLYFFGNHLSELWSTDGTAAGTRAIKNVSYDYKRLTMAVGNLLFFTYGYDEVWRSDGTVEGTIRVHKSLFAENYDRTPDRLTALGDRLLFSAVDGVHGHEPWISDGTDEGTHLLANVHPETIVRGSVFDAATGEPVAAIVSVHRKRAENWTESASASTAADGTFVIEGLRDGTYTLSVYPKEQRHYVDIPERLRTFEAKAGTTFYGFDLPLRRGAAISGRVVDERGQPISGARIEVRETWGGSSVAWGTTDAEGRYVTKGAIPPDRGMLVIARAVGRSTVLYDGISCADGCLDRPEGKRVATGPGKTTEGIDFVLLPLGSVAGRIIDGVTGEPIQSMAFVSYRGTPSWEPPAHQSGADGVYTLRLGDGSFHLFAIPPADQYVPAFYPNVPCSDPACTTPRGTPVSAVPGKTTAGYDIVVMPVGARVKGQVIDAASGLPLAKQTIVVRNEEGTIVLRTVTVGDGYYETPPSLRPGTYRVEAISRTGHVSFVHPRAITVSGTDVVRGVDFALARLGTLSGIIRDGKTEEPLSGARIFISDASGVVVAKTHTNEFGGYTIDVPTAAVTIRAEYLGWTERAADVVIASGETKNVDLSLAPACDVSVTPSPLRVSAAGGVQSLTVSAPCSVCAFDNSPFLAITRGTCASTELQFHVAPNGGAERRGAIVFPGLLVPVIQDGR